MTLKLFLDDKIHCLKHAIPAGSRCKLRLHDPARLSLVGSNTVISCNEAEGRLVSLVVVEIRFFGIRAWNFSFTIAL